MFARVGAQHREHRAELLAGQRLLRADPADLDQDDRRPLRDGESRLFDRRDRCRSFVNDADRMMAVTIGDESVAYPIRIMAYHHVVADTVGGTPIVATY